LSAPPSTPDRMAARMEKFVIEGGAPLSGSIAPAGNKNAALPALAACLLTDEEVIVRNVPRIRDVDAMIGLLKGLGVETAWREDNAVSLNAESEPHVQDLARMLLQMGARIEGIGSNVLIVHGSDKLQGADYTIGPDYIEVGSFIALAAVTRGELRIRGAVSDDLRMTRMCFERIGCKVDLDGDDIVVPSGQ